MAKLDVVDKSGKPTGSYTVDYNKVWQKNLEVANKRYGNWAERYRCNDSEEFYYGEQWDTSLLVDPRQYSPYVTNEIFSAIDVKSPSLLFQLPIYSIRPKPSKVNINADAAAQRANLRQDVLNYFAQSEKTGLAEAAELAILDGHFRFGIVEVGYSADWIDNPNAKAPVLNTDRGTDVYDDIEEEYVPPKLPQNERIYTKYIPAANFRVGGLERPESLERCSWCGYWEYYRYEDLVAAYDLDEDTMGANGFNTYGSELFSDEDIDNPMEEELRDSLRQSRLCKVWKIWDTREKQKIAYIENFSKVIRQQSYKRLPLFDLRFRKRLGSWYPLPPVYNWLGPQTEMNETRETARAHRRRFVRKFIMRKGGLSDPAKYSLQNGPDGTIVETEDEVDPSSIIYPMPNADLGAHHAEMLQVSRNDFDNVAGVTPQQRGQGTGETATESNIIDSRSTIREERDKFVVARWLCRIGKEILLQAKEKLSADIIVPITQDVDERETPIGELELTNTTWMQINTSSLGDEDMDVNIDVSSLSPVSNQREKEAFIEFISVLSNFPPLNLSDVLVREAATKVGYTNEKVIQTWQKMAMLNLNATMATLELQNAALQTQKLALQNNENTQAQGEVARNNPNTQDQINQQINNQAAGGVQ